MKIVKINKRNYDYDFNAENASSSTYLETVDKAVHNQGVTTKKNEKFTFFTQM